MTILEGEFAYGRRVLLLTDEGETISRKVQYKAKSGPYVIVNDKEYTYQDIENSESEMSFREYIKYLYKRGYDFNKFNSLINRDTKIDMINNYCPVCGSLIESANFCSVCGQRLKDT